MLRIDPEVNFDERLIHEYKKLGLSFRTFDDDIYSFIQPRYNMILDLNGFDEESLLMSFSQKTRYNVRKSCRNNILTKIEKPDEKNIDDFFKLTKIMAKRQNISHRPKEYFKRLAENYDVLFANSFYQNNLLSSCLLLKYKDKIYYLYAASGNEKRNLMPTYNMIWHCLKYALNHNYRYFDFGGTFSLSKEDGLYRFKEGFCHPNKYTAFIGELDKVYKKENYDKFNKK